MAASKAPLPPPRAPPEEEEERPRETASRPPVVSGVASVPPRNRFQLPFPGFLERVFAPLDDALIAVGQRRTAGSVHFFAMALTFFTSIEVSLVAPPALYALGYDAAAGLATSVLLVLGVVSQVPKKFIFRPRPWMVGRALPIRRDKTSSFPSRAVVCAVVFSWLIGSSLELERLLSRPLPPVVLWLGITLVACLAAFARINVGAHYPSDTLLGFALGCLVVKIGTRVEEMWRAAGCAVEDVYPMAAGSVIASKGDLLRLGRGSLFGLVLVTAVAYAMTLISIQGFWVKCSYVYGLLMSSAAFRATFLCAGRANSVKFRGVAQVFDHGSMRDHVQATTIFAVLLFFGMLTRGKKGKFRVVTFSLIYLGTLIGILYWRLRPGQVEATRE